MAKKNYIRLEFDAPAYVLGLASTEKIWKVVWNVNQALGLNMSTSASDVTSASAPELYLDPETDPDFEFILFENTDKSRKVPRRAREFRFWLAIKPRREKKPDLEGLMLILRGVENISLVIDLSAEENIKSLLP